MFEATALALLAEAGRVLGESLDLSATFAGVARLCVSGLAEVAIFDLVDGGARPVSVAQDQRHRSARPSASSGWSTTSSIVAAHGGRISLRSEPGKGATFGVALPLS